MKQLKDHSLITLVHCASLWWNIPDLIRTVQNVVWTMNDTWTAFREETVKSTFLLFLSLCDLLAFHVLPFFIFILPQFRVVFSVLLIWMCCLRSTGNCFTAHVVAYQYALVKWKSQQDDCRIRELYFICCRYWNNLIVSSIL